MDAACIVAIPAIGPICASMPWLGAPLDTKPVALSLTDARALVEQMGRSEAWRKIDAMEEELEQHPDVAFELVTNHVFTPGLYMRSVFMKAGDFVTTRIHLTEHPYIISAGRVLVWTDDQGVVELCASHQGVTKPGTRRLLYIVEDCIWTTCHANPDNETDPDKIVEHSTYNNRLLRQKMRDTL